MKDSSDKFIKDNVRGADSMGKSGDSASKPAKKRSMTPGSDEIISSYPGSHASEAASPKVTSDSQDLGLDVNTNKKE